MDLDAAVCELSIFDYFDFCRFLPCIKEVPKFSESPLRAFCKKIEITTEKYTKFPSSAGQQTAQNARHEKRLCSQLTTTLLVSVAPVGDGGEKLG